MERQILLESNKSKFSVDVENKIGIDLDGKFKMLQGDKINGNFSLLEQYNSERDSCNKFRMIFVVNPVCTNAIFNMHTEIVQGEGSDNPIVLGENSISPSSILTADGSPDNSIVNISLVNRHQAIKDTEYSHPENGGFVYHCGLDIFNNHMLRNNSFVHVNKVAMNTYKVDEETSEEVYNTISDYLRDGNGKIIEKIVSPEGNEKVKMRLYTIDNTLSMKRAYINRLKDSNGWLGFTNPGNIDIPNSDKKDKAGNYVLLNQMLLDHKPCEFIDMYPDRSLYSFIPKYNSFRDRREKNWDYCMTYPYAKDVKMVNTVCGGLGGAIRAEFEFGNNSSSVNILMCRSLFRHTLAGNSMISFYYYEGNTFKKYPIPIQVISVGNYDGSETDRYFSIRANDIEKAVPYLTSGRFFYKKIVGGCECDYYFRKYKKLKRIDSNGNVKDLRSDVNKLAYGENIYGDRVAQVVFIDDINVEGLLDHMGRPVSNVYFTTVKRNAGHKEWYDDKTYGSPKVEFSHCFGKVSSAVDFGPSSATSIDYNVRYLHNVNLGNVITQNIGIIDDAFGEVVANNPEPKRIEDDITIDMDVFYGDVVEFDKDSYIETEISPVFHRFNTEQREKCSKIELYPLNYEKIVSDVYDPNKKFKVKKENYSKITINNEEIVIPSNIRPEGYFYNPHMAVKIREDAEQATRIRAKLVNYGIISCGIAVGGKYTTIHMKAPSSYNFLKWDYIAFCDDGGIVNGVEHLSNVVWGKITEASGSNVTLQVDGMPFGTSAAAVKNVLYGEGRRYKAYYAEESIPLYASFNPSTQEFIWRPFVAPSTMTTNNELFDMPFSNGRFYIEKNLNLYLRRQDPYGDFGLSVARHTDDGLHYRNPMEFFNVDATKIDFSSVYNFFNKLDYICY